MRSILHIDMNAFYCACHAAADPDRYQGLPTAVAGSPETRHGVVVTASYEARRRGVRATMTVAEALRACADLTLIAPDFDLYRDFSRRVFAVVRNYTPQVEVFSIDECWADVTGSRQFGTAVEIARQIQTRIQSELGLPCSIGVAPNKFLAKMASDLKKPMGLTEIALESVPHLLWPLSVESMFGVGGKTAERLRRLGVSTIGDLAGAREELLQRYLGRRGPELRRLANGLDDTPVVSVPEPIKSVGHSVTLAADTDAEEELATVLLNLADQVGRRVRRHKMVGRTVQLTIRYGNRETVTRSRTLPLATDLTEEIYREARGLLTLHKRRGAKVRLLGVALQNLTPTGALAGQNGPVATSASAGGTIGSGGRPGGAQGPSDTLGPGGTRGSGGTREPGGAIGSGGTIGPGGRPGGAIKWAESGATADTAPSLQLELPLFEAELRPSKTDQDSRVAKGPGAGRNAGLGAGRAAGRGPSVYAAPTQNSDRDRLARLTKVTDELRDKFGENALVRGRMLKSHPSAQIRDRKVRGTSLQKDTLQAPDDPR
ncbi:DNA polymerase IV [Alicyclobacillus sp. ALC3]|uniref:DNA polymerase IV n=1 Tax=Alicyclobacillus sp. ALC3 TaxID=2796143 RepID=UPI0023792F8E|nr:DNA polymerase IV [Alicyclobacillus sp. ALC3]WDL95591.1 DNA polymerase IV [Alicyclobacillus sp. ALC3]